MGSLGYEWVIGALLLALIPAAIGKSKGYSFFGWYCYGVFLFIVAFPHSLLIKRNPDALPSNNAQPPAPVQTGSSKSCEHCSQIIPLESVYCRFCGNGVSSQVNSSSESTPIGNVSSPESSATVAGSSNAALTIQTSSNISFFQKNKKKIIIGVPILTVVIIGIAAALWYFLTGINSNAKWQYVAVNKNAKFYVDVNSIKKDGQLIAAWVMNDFIEPRNLSSGGTYLSAAFLNNYDCSNNLVHAVKAIGFRKNMAQERIGFSTEKGEKSYKVKEGTPAYEQLTFICNSSVAQNSALTSASSNQSFKRNALISSENMRAQVDFFEKKFSLTPKTVQNFDYGVDKKSKKIQARTYEIDGCELVVEADSTTKSIVSISGNIDEKCGIKYSDSFDSSKTTLKSIIESNKSLHFSAMLVPGNVEVAWYGQILSPGTTATNNIDVTYTVENSDGVHKWRNLVVASEGNNSDKFESQLWCNTKYDSDAAKTWGDAKINGFKISWNLYEPVGTCSTQIQPQVVQPQPMKMKTEGKLEVVGDWGFIHYQGGESGDWVPYYFKTNSPVGEKILATCKNSQICRFNGSVVNRESTPIASIVMKGFDASDRFEIVSVQTADIPGSKKRAEKAQNQNGQQTQQNDSRTKEQRDMEQLFRGMQRMMRE